ncbi:uncharacterized protein [Nicotiana tomentosiformis]|uniref:uncharacterized protein n=1 Tax=Nicotiana tomentosiformis TaxID=4098 RepID=UPI00388C6247
MVRTRSTLSSAANNVEIPTANHQEVALEVQAALIAPVAVRGRGRGRGIGQNARGRGGNAREYAPNLIQTEREKVRRFIEGLNPYMAKDMTSHQDDKIYLQVVNIARRKEAFDKIAREARDNSKKARTTGIYSEFSVGGKRHPGKCLLGQKACFHCHDPSHIKRDCPLLRQAPGKTPTKQATSIGILSVCSRLAYVLVDHGSTFSYVAPYFYVEFGKAPEKLGVPFEIFTPIGESVKVEYIFRNYIITVQGRETLVDLNLLDMVDFDIIAGMDWLSSCHVTVDCHTKTVKFSFIGEDPVIIRGEVGTPVGKFISYLKARKLVSIGCLAYLAHVRDMKADFPMLESVQIVKEFSEVFPDDLPRIPPDREIEFGIDTLPGTQPILIPPYRMAQSKLNELKK